MVGVWSLRPQLAKKIPRIKTLSLPIPAQTTLEVRNTGMPRELQPQKAPAPPARARCVVTGAPARYRDPLTGAPYVDAAAFAYIRRTMKVPAAPS